MKFYILILVLILNSCGNQKEQNEIPYFVEKKLSFKFLKEQYKPSNNWIKQSNNILMLHETFKSVGYPQLLDYLNWTESGTLQIDNKRSLHTLIDSLALTYKSKEAPIYYKQFWERRASEGNKEVVYKKKEITNAKLKEKLLTLIQKYCRLRDSDKK